MSSIQKFLESNIPEDQLIAIELIKNLEDEKELDFIPINGDNKKRNYLLNRSGIEGFIPFRNFYLLIGCDSFRKMPSNDSLVTNRYKLIK